MAPTAQDKPPGCGAGHGMHDAGDSMRMRDTDTFLITVDTEDRETGVIAKMEAHRKGILHRAFSIFVFDEVGRLLLQRRASDKYHSGGLWSNTCCGHPKPGESLLGAAHRRLREEMGFDCPLRAEFGFVYRASLDGGLVEHEFDHVVVGRFQGNPAPDPREVAEWKWAFAPAVQAQLAGAPEAFTAWFRVALDGLLARGVPPAGRDAGELRKS